MASIAGLFPLPFSSPSFCAPEIETSYEEFSVECLSGTTQVQFGQMGDGLQTKMWSGLGDSEIEEVYSVPTWSKDCSPVLRVRKLHINSTILASRNPYFYKLFLNGMPESEQRDVKLRISASEFFDCVVMETDKVLLSILNIYLFTYFGMISTNDLALLLDLLVVADKFEVASCVHHCSKLLGSLPMTRECAIKYLEHPYRMIDAIRPLVVVSKQYLAKQYQDLFESHDELMALPLSAIEAVLSSYELHVGLGDVVFDLALEWAHAKYPNFEERREILGSHIVPAICFSSMSTHKQKVVLECEDIELVAREFIVKAEEAELRHCVANCAYKRPPLKVIQLAENPAKCLVFMDLQREECAALFPTDP
ncbi:BTB/POZ domain-containing protein POB1-like [Amborella trichopoda]|uniref:BTB/POZ domain-containing protein POB1-like n=1 Tax=Amborella trichopoda TaxID=13333 RepID=UPI0005D2E806|nr:BTB/POZ domain-containing protein POB1-like [Amborella trichopoda]|eukprot:XP_011629420.1 BTB/POZ domain-containing protein POB1-like [Amborella trichopoda]